MRKRYLSLLLCVLMMAALLPALNTTADATQSMSGNFWSYTTTGNPIDDIVACARAQEGRTGQSLGYTEAWCADFVSDCAKLVGQSSAIPFSGVCNTLRNAIINAGGYYVTTPQKGDLIFWGGNHVALMIDDANCIHGNVSWAGSPYKVYIAHYTVDFAAGTRYYVRPNYRYSTYTLDVNGYLDGADSHYIGDYGTFDVYINGNRVADDVNDYYASHPAGTSYKITDIKPKDGKAYQGYASGSDTITGTLDANRNVRLWFFTPDAHGWTNNNKPAAISVYNGHTYHYYSTAVTWWGAKKVAEYLGGHLVTISSAGENSFVYNLGGNDKLWLGATDRDREGTWKWVNGESFSYSNWGSGEPNNSAGSLSGTQNYAVMWAREGEEGTWDDEDGSTPYPFVIEFDKAYTVLYNANGGTGAPAAQTKAYGKSLTLSSEVPTRSGYIFLGWATSSAATSASYLPGNVYSREANLTLYAVWKSIVQVSASSSQIIGNIGDSVNVTLTQTGGAVGGTWTAAGLPAGLSINPNTGVISGTLTTAGKGKFTVTYTTPEGKSGSAQVWYSVQKPGSNNYALYMETEKLGAYELKFVVFDAEVEEHEGAAPRGMSTAPEGYGYYNATAKARIVFDSVNGKNAYPAGGGMVLRLGHSASGSAYESQEKMIECANVEIGMKPWVGNYLPGSNAAYEENADKARVPFTIDRSNPDGIDEMGNKYYEFDISFSNMLAKPGDSFPLSIYAFVSGDGRVSISYQGYGGVIEKPVVVSVVSGSIDIPDSQQPPAPTDKLGAYEGRLTVFDAEATEETASYIQESGLRAAPEGYGYYKATAKVRFSYDSVNPAFAFPSGGYFILRMGHSASGSAYGSGAAMAAHVQLRDADNVYLQTAMTNYAGNMTYEADADKARYPFAIKSPATAVDENGNKYYEFDIILRGMLARPGDSFPVELSEWVDSYGVGSIVLLRQDGQHDVLRPVSIDRIGGVITIPGGQQPPAPTDKLGAYEGRFTVFDAEATEEEPRYLGTLGLGEAPEGYGYYQLSARARLSYDETVAGMYPSGGIFMLAVGAAESGAVYPTQEALANNKLVSFEGDDKFGVYGSATNYVGSMTDEEAAGIYKARYAFAVGGDISSPDEAGNRYFEFDIILRGVLAKAGESFELKLDGWVNDGTGQISYQSSSGSISERMNVVESKSGVITIPEANGVLSFTKDDVETDAIKLLRWQGMDAEATGEPRNRGYDPTQTSDTVGIRLNGAPMAYSAANLAKAKELFKGVKYESLTHSGAVSQRVAEQADGSLTVGDKLKISFGSSGGNITATVTALKPVAMRLTMADGSECLIATPGDVNLDGSMDANDWTTIMRWSLQASSRLDVTDYPGFTLNGQSFDLWALLADMTGTGVSGNRGDRVDANDWTTIMYLTLQAWKK